MDILTWHKGMETSRLVPYSEPENLDQFVATAIEAERLGFQGILAFEHHFQYSKFLTFPLQALAATASVTTKIRLYTGAMLLPLYDPIRAAEAAATVDILCGGRLTLGLGMGYRPMEFDGLGLSKKTRGARLAEAIDVLKLATGQERFSYQGKHYQYTNVELSPRPIQKPIDMFFCGGAAPAGAKRAGQGGFGFWIANAPFDHVEVMMQLYRDSAKQAGYPIEQTRVNVFKDIFIGTSLAEAREARDLYLEDWFDEHLRCYGYLQDANGVPLFSPPKDHPAYLAAVDGMFCGTPDMVVAELKRYEGIGINAITLQPFQMEMFAKYVLPEFINQ